MEYLHYTIILPRWSLTGSMLLFKVRVHSLWRQHDEKGAVNMIIIDEKTMATLIIILVILGILFLIRTVFCFIKWILSSICRLFIGKPKRKNPLESDNWLTRAQARQKIRFENSLPPITPKQKPRKHRKHCKKDITRYPSGWTLNQETGMWEPPDYLIKQSNDEHINIKWTKKQNWGI